MAQNYEVTFIDSGKTVIWPESKCRKHFGTKEWKEVKAGYLPHIVAVKTEKGDRQ